MTKTQPPPLNYATPGVTGAQDRPWLPQAMMGMSFLFGPVAGGVAAGINFKRMGKGELLWPCALLAGVVFVVEAVLIAFVLDERALQPVGFLINIGLGAAFYAWQNGTFNQWKARNWRPAAANERYKPSRIGLMFGVGLICVVGELAVLFGLMMASGRF